jgi:hypothetical protein
VNMACVDRERGESGRLVLIAARRKRLPTSTVRAGRGDELGGAPLEMVVRCTKITSF